VTEPRTGPGQPDALGTASHVAAVASVTVAVIGALLLARAIEWPGDRNDLMLLSAMALYLATQAGWFFNARWRLLADPADRRVRNIFLPIAAYFALRLLLELVALPPATLQTIDDVAWAATQLVALALAAWAFREGAAASRLLGAVRFLVLPAAVEVLAHRLASRGVIADLRPLEPALAAGFLIVAAPLLLPGRSRPTDWRAPWLGATLLLVAFAHLHIAWSTVRFDEPLLWGHVLLAVGMVIPLVGAIRENASLIRSQSALSDRLHRHRESTDAMLDGLPVLVLSLDRQLRVRYANRSASALLGVTRGITVGDPDLEWLERFPPPDRGRLRAAVPVTIDRSSGIWEAVVRVTDDAGQIHWLNTQLLPVHDPAAGETLVELVATDVSDLFLARRVAEARQTRMAFLSNVAQTVAGETEDQRVLERFLELGQEIYPIISLVLYRPRPDGVSFTIEAATGPGADLLRRARAASIGVGHPCRLTFRDAMPRAAAVGDIAPGDLSERLGAEHGISHVLYLPLLSAGRVVGVLAATTNSEPELDTAEIELLTQVGFLLGGAVFVSQLVRELDEQRAVAMEASRLKSEFLANTSHELRTPLTAILGFLKLVLDGAVDDQAKQREFLGIAHEAAEKLLTIINDVLDLAKIEAGRLEVHHTPVPARRVIEEVETLFRHQMKGQGLNFTSLPAPPTAVLWADPDRSVQILTNLLSNAMKFTPRGGTITLACSAAEGQIEFTVRDTGCGIPEVELEAVFDSFYQVDGSTTRRHGGTGLGLTISRRLAEMMGGTLELESAGEGQGTVARLRLAEYSTERLGGAAP
jgi:signal transduction histidine kinase/PAS domain-containing protein